MKRVLIPLLCLLLIACSASSNETVVNTALPEETALPESTETADAAEQGSAQTAAKNNFPFSTTDLDGNPFDQDCFQDYDLIMLNFFTYWCGPCIGEFPELEQIHQNYPNVLLLGITIDNDDMSQVRAAVDSGGITYPVLLPAGGLLYLGNQCQYIPTTYFLSPEGEILGDPIVGSNDYNGWSQVIESYLS